MATLSELSIDDAALLGHVFVGGGRGLRMRAGNLAFNLLAALQAGLPVYWRGEHKQRFVSDREGHDR